jgi:peptidoglycan/LPS O-acetylase OafA/YrhL
LIKGIHGPGDIPQLFLLQSWHRIDDPMFPSANRPSWTLSVELGFYFVLPLVLFWLSKIRNLLVPIIALTIIMVAIEGPGSPSYHGYPLPQLDGIVPNVILRLPEFVLGACLGLQFVRGRRLSAGQAYGLLFASLTIIVGAVMTSQSSLNGTIAGVGFAGLIFATASANDFGPVRSVLESRVLVFLGQASFCLYILQEPVHDCLTLVTPSRLVEQLLFYPVLFAAACLIHVYFEETARKGIRRLFSLPAKAPTAP